MSKSIVTNFDNDIALNSLVQNAVSLVERARSYAAKQTDKIQILTNYIIGSWIVEVQQEGNARAGYGKRILEQLSTRMTEQFGKGFSVDTLEKMRKFYLTYRGRISAPPVRKFDSQKSAPAVRISEEFPFSLSWTHYLILMRIENAEERDFYEKEAAEQNWGKRELSRQYSSSLYERLLLSQDKKEVMSLAKKGKIIENSKDIIKDPYVLEFLGLEETGKTAGMDRGRWR